MKELRTIGKYSLYEQCSVKSCSNEAILWYQNNSEPNFFNSRCVHHSGRKSGRSLLSPTVYTSIDSIIALIAMEEL